MRALFQVLEMAPEDPSRVQPKHCWGDKILPSLNGYCLLLPSGAPSISTVLLVYQGLVVGKVGLHLLIGGNREAMQILFFFNLSPTTLM